MPESQAAWQVSPTDNRLNFIRLQVFIQIELCKSVQEYSYLSECKSEQGICKKLVYLLRLISFDQPNRRQIGQFKKCWNYLQVLIGSSANSKLVANFPLLAIGLQKFYSPYSIQEIDDSTVKKQRQKSYKTFLCQKNKQDAFFVDDSTKGIEISGLTNKDKILLLYPACFGCSSYFLKGAQIQNKNPYYQHLVPLTAREVLAEGKFEKIVLGMANTGGGIIIVGAEKSVNGIIIEGFKIGESVQKLQKQFFRIEGMGQQMDQSEKGKKSQYLIESNTDKVLLMNQQFVEIPSFCYRIIIEPFTQNYPCFKLKHVTGQVKCIKMYYEIKQGKQRQFVDADKNFYAFIHKKHAFDRKSTTKSHGKTTCFNRSEEVFLDFYRKYLLNAQKDESQSEFSQENIEIHDIECPMKHHKNILLIMNHPKYVRFEKELRNQLSAQELHNYELIVPFQEYQKKYQESQLSDLFFLMSHVFKNKRLKELMPKDKNNAITYMQVHTTIRIDTMHKNRVNIKKLNSQICGKFGEEFPIGEKNSSFIIELNDKRQAIYSYLVSELQFNTKPIFIKKEKVQ